MTCRSGLLSFTCAGVQSFILFTGNRFLAGPTGSSSQTNTRAVGPEAALSAGDSYLHQSQPNVWRGNKIRAFPIEKLRNVDLCPQCSQTLGFKGYWSEVYTL